MGSKQPTLRASILLRCSKTTPYTVLLGCRAVRMVQATLVAAIAAAVQFASLALLRAQEIGRPALMIEIDGAIGPATSRHVKEALTTAGERRVDVVILRLNTPGGLATSMREMIADVLGSSVPVIGYVAPSGAHAASAGTYILFATHIAAMAPGTNLGAATPVQIGGPLPGLPGSAPDKDGKDKKDDARQPALKDAMTAKATNDAVALIRSLAELRGRNADWAEKAVREAASLSASAALQMNVIDLVARNPTELLQFVDGRTVELAGGDMRQLATKGLTIERLDPGWLIRLLSVITNPNVAFILLMVGIYGLIFELSTPGAIAPGVIGTICLLLGLYALNSRSTTPAWPCCCWGSRSWSSKSSTLPWFSGLAALPRFFWEPPCCSRSRGPGTGCHGRSSSLRWQ